MPWIVLFLMLLTSAVIDILSWPTYRDLMQGMVYGLILVAVIGAYSFVLWPKRKKADG
jgi:hypothetical protein